MTDELIPFLTASILLTLSPGPDIIYVLVQGMSRGKKSGIFTAIGLVSGILVHTTLLAFGVSAVIRESEFFFLVIKIFGAAYLFYLSYRVLQSAPEIHFSPTKAVEKKSFFDLLRRGFLMNVLNPKVGIFFLAFFPGFLWEPSGNIVVQFYLLGLLFMVQAFIIFASVALLADKISVYLWKYPSSGVIFKWLQVAVLLGIGIFILL